MAAAPPMRRQASPRAAGAAAPNPTDATSPLVPTAVSCFLFLALASWAVTEVLYAAVLINEAPALVLRSQTPLHVCGVSPTARACSYTRSRLACASGWFSS